MKVHNMEQGTDEWFAVRAMKMTASHATAIGNAGKGLDTYIIDIMAQHYSSGGREELSNKHIDRGNELEPLARDMYELENGCEITEVGFVEYSTSVGCSPDGLIGGEGGLEIKCMGDSKHLKLMVSGSGGIDTGHIRQVQMCLLITGRERRDYVAFNPNFKNSLLVYRIEPDEEKFERLRKGFEVGEQKILSIKDRIGGL